MSRGWKTKVGRHAFWLVILLSLPPTVFFLGKQEKKQEAELPRPTTVGNLPINLVTLHNTLKSPQRLSEDVDLLRNDVEILVQVREGRCCPPGTAHLPPGCKPFPLGMGLIVMA